jgi:hypothetical protein
MGSQDIVSRLEHYAFHVMPDHPNDICSEAKREIERLRDRIALLEGASPIWPGPGGDGEPKCMREAATKITEGMA